MLYTDGAHLIADSIQELFEYGGKVGLNADWTHIMGKNFHPHFDICGHVRRRVLADQNVKQVTRKEIVRLCKLNYKMPDTEQEVKEWETHHKQSIEDLHKPSEKEYEGMFENIFKRAGLR